MPPYPFDTAEARDIYEFGLTDREMAFELNTDIDTITLWRNRNKLPENESLCDPDRAGYFFKNILLGRFITRVA